MDSSPAWRPADTLDADHHGSPYRQNCDSAASDHKLQAVAVDSDQTGVIPAKLGFPKHQTSRRERHDTHRFIGAAFDAAFFFTPDRPERSAGADRTSVTKTSRRD